MANELDARETNIFPLCEVHNIFQCHSEGYQPWTSLILSVGQQVIFMYCMQYRLAKLVNSLPGVCAL